MKLDYTNDQVHESSPGIQDKPLLGTLLWRYLLLYHTSCWRELDIDIKTTKKVQWIALELITQKTFPDD